MTNFKEELTQMGTLAKDAAIELASLSTEKKNTILQAIADEIIASANEIQDINKLDLIAGKEAGLTSAMIDRLELNDARIQGMADGLKDIIALDDPIGKSLSKIQRPNGIEIEKISVPIGVIGIIYESRPNVTVDAAGLCLKAGNPVFLKGGKEAIHSNKKLAEIMSRAGKKTWASKRSGSINSLD